MRMSALFAWNWMRFKPAPQTASVCGIFFPAHKHASTRFCFILLKMKPAAKNEAPFSEFRNFFVSLVKRRVFLFSLFLGMAALLILLLLSEFSLPQFYAFGFVFVGFAWAAYQAYRDLSLKYQETLSQIPGEKVKGAGLSISFAHGKEYAYSLSDPYQGQNNFITKTQKSKKVRSRFDERGVFFINDKVYYVMGKGCLEINIQIHNSGDLPLDVLSIETDNNLRLNHLRLHLAGIFHYGKEARLPVHLESGEVIILQARYGISINRGSNEALFAADFRALPRFITHKVSVEALAPDQISQTCLAELKTPSQPLADLYIKQWREYEQEEYLILSGYDLESKV
jgi:hypothetical protein